MIDLLIKKMERVISWLRLASASEPSSRSDQTALLKAFTLYAGLYL